jgi:outer membrane protein OmpA-like peptidoglycan-associated protein
MRSTACVLALVLASGLPLAHASAVDEAPSGVEVTPIEPPAVLATLKLDVELRSIRYALFFTPGSARLGPKAIRTIGVMAPLARASDRIVVVGRADATGNPKVNAALGMLRAQAVANALRAAGATTPSYELSHDTSSTADLAQDVHVLWQPQARSAQLRRADIDLRAPVEEAAAEREPLALRTAAYR